jgi:hypothetical protein
MFPFSPLLSLSGKTIPEIFVINVFFSSILPSLSTFRF